MTERNTQRGWEERLKSLQFSQNGIICPSCRIQDFVCRHCIRDFIATELTKAREEGYADGVVSYTESTAINDIGVTLLKVEQIRSEAVKSYRQELRKKVEGMLDPYPEGLFHPVSTEDIDRVADFCKGAGFSIDRLSAYMYRRARKTMKEDLLTIISE